MIELPRMDQLMDLSVLDRIKEYEKEKKFSEHVDPIDYGNFLPVDETFKYFPTSFPSMVKSKLIRHTAIRKFVNQCTNDYLDLEIVGKENLKGIKNAIITCNHINKLDTVAVMKACRGHHFRFTVAEFNNQKGMMGEMFRYAGYMPIPTQFRAFKNFDNALEKCLKSNTYVLFFPEVAEWWNYKKVRPFQNGAFHYAVKFNVPVIPMFITLKETDQKYDNGLPISKFTLHIMKPIYKDETLDDKHNVDLMRDVDYNMCKALYEQVYGESLVYEE